MKTNKIVFITLVSIFLFVMTCAPAFAEILTSNKAGTFTFDPLGFKLDVQPNAASQTMNVTATATNYNSIVPQSQFYVTRSVELNVMYSSGHPLNSFSNQARLSFTFDNTDYLRASNMNTNQPIGRFRIGYWNGTNWDELPSEIIWNGSNGVVEAETNHADGRYALLWSYSDDAQLSQMAEDEIRVMVNSKLVDIDVKPYMNNGRVMVPLRSIAESLGANIYWVSSENRIDLQKNFDKVQLWIGKTQAQKNNDSITLDVAPEMVQDHTFVPLRFVAEAFGAKVTWDDLTQTARIISN